MTTLTTLDEVSEEYIGTSGRLLRQANAEFEKGDLLQASEKAWGAVSQYLKAMATQRGMPHRVHRELRLVANDLVEETGQRRIGELFAIAESLHANYYEAWMPEREVRDRIDDMKELIGILESVPRPEGAPKRSVRRRAFIRDRGDG